MWNVIRVAYFGKNRTALLLGPIADMVGYLRAQAGVESLTLSSHWKFGPHIDITVKCDESLFNQQLFPHAQQHIGQWLADNPSAETLDPVQYERLSYQLAISELEMPPYLPLLDNNSVTIGQYQPSRAIVLPQLVEAKETFLASATDVLFQLLKLRVNDSDATFTTLALMMAVMASKYVPDGIQRGYISYRSHAEFFFENFDKTGNIRKQIDMIDMKYQPFMDSVLKATVAADYQALSVSDDVKAILVSWDEVITKTFAHNLAVVNDNYDKLVALDSDVTKGEEHLGNLASKVASEVPQQYRPKDEQQNVGVVVNSVVQFQEGRDLLKSADFITYRTTVNFFYVLLPILDVSPTQKFALCHMLANAVERVYQMSWRDIVPTQTDNSENAGGGQ